MSQFPPDQSARGSRRPGLPAEPGRRRGRHPVRRRTLVVAAVPAAVVLAGLGTYRVGRGGGAAESPEVVVRRYFQAALDGDCATLVDTIVLVDRTRDELLGECQLWLDEAGLGAAQVPAEAAAGVPAELVGVAVSERTATDAVGTIDFRTRGGETGTDEVALVRLDGVWRIDIDGTARASLDHLPSADVGGGGPAELGPGMPPPVDLGLVRTDPELVELANSCWTGDMGACDDLYGAADGDLEDYGAGCGGRVSTRPRGGCDRLEG